MSIVSCNILHSHDGDSSTVPRPGQLQPLTLFLTITTSSSPYPWPGLVLGSGLGRILGEAITEGICQISDTTPKIE